VIDKNYLMALEYYQKSPDLNNSHALNNIVYIYKNECGVIINIFKTLKYYLINIKINNNLLAIGKGERQALWNNNPFPFIFKKRISFIYSFVAKSGY
jgi:hypothetical protein